MPIVTSEKLSFTIGMLPNRRPAPRHRPTHSDRADDVVEDEGLPRHLRRAGDERHEGPHDRHEPAQDHRLAAVLLEERVRPLQVLAVQQPVRRRRCRSSAVNTRGPMQRPIE